MRRARGREGGRCQVSLFSPPRVTDEDGRCVDLLTSAQPGTYHVHFDTAAYFATVGNHEPFYPYVDVRG